MTVLELREKLVKVPPDFKVVLRSIQSEEVAWDEFWGGDDFLFAQDPQNKRVVLLTIEKACGGTLGLARD